MQFVVLYCNAKERSTIYSFVSSFTQKNELKLSYPVMQKKLHKTYTLKQKNLYRIGRVYNFFLGKTTYIKFVVWFQLWRSVRRRCQPRTRTHRCGAWKSNWNIQVCVTRSRSLLEYVFKILNQCKLIELWHQPKKLQVRSYQIGRKAWL
jgi:hypothetical protein